LSAGGRHKLNVRDKSKRIAIGKRSLNERVSNKLNVVEVRCDNNSSRKVSASEIAVDNKRRPLLDHRLLRLFEHLNNGTNLNPGR
jgi:hypothetical protein